MYYLVYLTIVSYSDITNNKQAYKDLRGTFWKIRFRLLISSKAIISLHSMFFGDFRPIGHTAGMNTILCLSSGYLRVAEEEQAEDRIGSEEINEGPAKAPACQR